MMNPAIPTQRSTDYRKRAEECVTIAQSARTAEQRTMLLHIAETWLRLADSAGDAGKSAAASMPARQSPPA